MIVHLLVLAASAAVLVKSADWLVEFASRLARRGGLSDLVIGLTLTSIGTSVPELAGALSATLQGHSGLALGSVTGSNIANIGLILGLAAFVKPFATEAKMHDRDGFVMFAAALLLFGFVQDNRVDRLDAAIFVALYAAYLVFLTRTDTAEEGYRFRDFIEFIVDLPVPLGRLRGRREGGAVEEAPDGDQRDDDGSDVADHPERGPEGAAEDPAARTGRMPPWAVITLEVLAVLASCVGVALGARYLVAEAAWLAARLGIPDALVGLSLIAVGTSLPELTVALTAARRGRPEMVVGNVMGSNIANILLVLGICGLARPLDVSEFSVVYTIPILLFFTLGLLYVVRSRWRVTRTQGGLVLGSYVAFLAIAFVQGWG